ncbi:MAG: hypothetical protein H0T97_12610 [Actinobacteria bacterium]|nr:hypothetical protein [Actinomycetota bacterium]
MRLEAAPPVSPAALAALEGALARAGIGFDALPDQLPTAGWRRVAAAEAVNAEVLGDYARSPRSTPGATRA